MLWRIPAGIGGAGGLASLVLPYALVTGGTLGIGLREESYTLLGLARLIANNGGDPTAVYAIALLVVVGSTVALLGAATRPIVVAVGCVLQGVATVGFVYGALTRGSRTILFGLGQIELSLELGVYVLAVATSLTLGALLIRGLESAADRLITDPDPDPSRP